MHSCGIYSKVSHGRNRQFACWCAGKHVIRSSINCVFPHRTSCLVSGILSLSIRKIVERQKGTTLESLNIFRILSNKSIAPKKSYFEAQNVNQRSCCGRSKSEKPPISTCTAFPSLLPRTTTDPRSMAQEYAYILDDKMHSSCIASVNWQRLSGSICQEGRIIGHGESTSKVCHDQLVMSVTGTEGDSKGLQAGPRYHLYTYT